MIEIILEEKQELDFDKLKEMIEEKKANVGAGYLTDQGALFLVAADLGVSLEKSPKTEYNIKEIFIGARDITLIGRIITINPIRTFLKRDSDQESRNRIITIYDKDSSVRIKLWDELVDLPEQLNLRPGDLVKVSNCQVKSGMDNRPIVNLGSNSSIDLLINDNKYQIPTLSEITELIDDLTLPKDNLVVTGKINSDPRISEFTNSRGERSKSLHLELTNEDNSRNIRSVIWNINEVSVPKTLTMNSRIRLIGVKTKLGNPNFGNGDLEIHGDEGTVIELSDEESSLGNYILRIISKRSNKEESILLCMAIDKESRPYFLKVNTKLFELNLQSDDIIECYPNRILGNTIELTDQESFVQILSKDQEFPRGEQFESKIKNISITNKPYIVEAIVLQIPNKSEVNTKSGEQVTVADTIVGDDSGEIRLVGWRDNSELVSQLKIGERIKILAVNAVNGKEGNIELSLKPYSEIIEVS
jgi:replication factor A1